MRKSISVTIILLLSVLLDLSIACGLCGEALKELDSPFLSPANFDSELSRNRPLLLLIRTESCSECDRIEGELFPKLQTLLDSADFDQRVTLATFRIVPTFAYDSFLESSEDSKLFRSERLKKHKFELSEKGFLLFFNRKAKVDRACLLTIQEPTPELIKYISNSEVSLEALVEFISEHSEVFLEANYLESLRQRLDVPKEGDQCEVFESAPTREQFFEMVAANKPTILRGVAKGWKALSKWSNEFLREKFGHYQVNVKVNPSGDFEGCEEASKWADPKAKPIPAVVRAQLESPDMVVTRPADLALKFEEFMSLLNRSDELKANFYLEYFPIKEVPSMRLDIDDFAFAETLLKRDMFNVWVGNGRTLGKLHFDPYDNLLVMIAGRKNVTLIDPSRNEDVYEGHIREARFQYHRETSTFTRSNLMDSTSLVMSPVDIKKPNLDRYPRFASKLKRMIQCDIGEGDALFLPSFWWHEVQSEPDRYSRNVAVNYWYAPFWDKEFPCATCRLSFNYDKYRSLLKEFATKLESEAA